MAPILHVVVGKKYEIFKLLHYAAVLGYAFAVVHVFKVLKIGSLGGRYPSFGLADGAAHLLSLAMLLVILSQEEIHTFAPCLCRALITTKNKK